MCRVRVGAGSFLALALRLLTLVKTMMMKIVFLPQNTPLAGRTSDTKH